MSTACVGTAAKMSIAEELLPAKSGLKGIDETQRVNMRKLL